MKNLLTIAITCLFVFAGLAQGGEVTDERYDLIKKAVDLSAKSDYYNEVCDKQSALADGYIEKFRAKSELDDKKLAELYEIKKNSGKEIKDQIEEYNLTCKNLDFMMQRFDVMRKLKDVSYLLNGVDPATLPPDNMPDLESLMPPRRDLGAVDSFTDELQK